MNIWMTTKRILRKLGGDIERPKTVTFDGNLAGKETFNGETLGISGGVYVKVSDASVAADELQSIKATVFGIEGDVDMSGVTAVQQDDASTAFTVPDRDYPILWFLNADIHLDEGTVTKGVYVLYVSETLYLSAVTYGKETIHPIDRKYLGGVCLPVVEIADMNAITASESVAFTAAAENGLPCVVKWFSEDGTGMSIVLNLYVIDGVHQYSAFTQDAPLTIVKDSESGLWKLAG